MNSEINTKPKKLGREEEAKLYLENTIINRNTALFLVIFLLLTVISVPMIQFLGGSRSLVSSASESDSGKDEGFDISIKKLKIKIPTSDEIKRFETEVEERSIAANAIQPYIQYFLTEYCGAGNEQVYKGKGNWLFYRNDVDYIISDGFMQQTSESKAAKEIIKFRDFLKTNGIELIVVPAAAKTSIYPEMFVSSYNNITQPLQNPSYNNFIDLLEANGIYVINTPELLMQWKQETGQPQFLESDTHWTNEAVVKTAEQIAHSIRKIMGLKPLKDSGYKRNEKLINGLGDTAIMLRFPSGKDSRYKENIKIWQVKENNSLWKQDKNADILVLGDSYSNIYSLKDMGWGESAGLVEQLSYEMKRPVDKITLNAGGAYTTREELKRQMVRNPNRLDNTRVVVYEFAVRELAFGEWKDIDFSSIPIAKKTSPDIGTAETKSEPKAEKVKSDDIEKTEKPLQDDKKDKAEPKDVVEKDKEKKETAKPEDKSIVVEGTIASKSEVPAPGSVPYQDCVISLHLVDLKPISGDIKEKEIVVFMWGMRNDKLQSPAYYKNGQKLKLTLIPWSEAESEYGSYNRVELLDDNLLALDVYWGTAKK